MSEAMVGNIIWMVCVFGVGILLWGISVYAEKRKQPMWFFSGSYVSADTISDVKAYNRENAKMWRNYALMFFAPVWCGFLTICWLWRCWLWHVLSG